MTETAPSPKVEQRHRDAAQLKPCPFCGATDERLVQAFMQATETFAYWSVECLDCACEIASDSSQAEADAAWNKRALTPSGEVAGLVNDARWLLRFVQDHVGCTGHDWAKIHRAEHHLKQCKAIEALDEMGMLK